MLLSYLQHLAPRKAAIFLALICVAAYARTVHFGFVWDDQFYVLQNPAVHSWNQIPLWFQGGQAYADPSLDAPMFRPMRNLTYLMEWSLVGPRPALFHLTNVVLHALNAVLLFGMIYKLLGLLSQPPAETGAVPPPPAQCSTMILPAAFLATLLWALHPIQTESVAWIKSRDELLVTCFLLMAGHALLSPSITRGWSLLALAVSTSLALLSKEMAVTLPAVLALAAVVYWRQPMARPLLPAVGITACLTLAYLVARHGILGQTQQTPRLSGSLWYDALTTLAVVGDYARLLVLPLRQSAEYFGYPIQTQLLAPVVLVGLGIALTFAALALKLVFSPSPASRLAGLALFSFVATLLPVLNIIPMMQYLAERFLYLPSACLAMALAIAFSRFSRPAWLVPGTLIVVVVLLGLTQIRLGVWQSNATLYEANWKSAPRSTRAAQNYASTLGQQGRLAEAAEILLLLVDPKDPLGPPTDRALAHQGLAVVLSRTGRKEEARIQIEKALKIQPNQPDALMTLGAIRGNSGDHAGALEAFTSVSLVSPAYPGIQQSIAQARTMLSASPQATTSTLTPPE